MIDKAELTNTFAANLNRLMFESDISSKELARKTGLHADHVSNLRRRKSLPMVLTLCMIADALGCTPSDLLGEGGWREGADTSNMEERAAE